MGTPRSKPNTPKPQTQTGGKGVGSSVTPSDVFPSAGNKPTPPSMPRSAPMMASGVGKAAPTAPKRTPMMGSGVGKAAAAMKKGGMAKIKKDEMPSKMGKVKTSPKADGVATKGKTKGKMVAMAAGGMKGYKKGGMSCK